MSGSLYQVGETLTAFQQTLAEPTHHQQPAEGREGSRGRGREEWEEGRKRGEEVVQQIEFRNHKQDSI